MATLQELTDRLKEGISARNTAITTRNTALVEKFKTMNLTAIEILGKVKNLAGNSDRFRELMEEKEILVSGLRESLEKATRDQAEKQGRIDDLSRQLEAALATGRDVEALIAEIEKLKVSARESTDKITALTKDIENSSREIQEIIVSMNPPEDQEELQRLIVDLEQNINEINAALPEPASPVDVIPQATSAQRQKQVSELSMAPTPLAPAKKTPNVVVQREPTPQELNIINSLEPTPAEGARRDALMIDPALADWRKRERPAQSRRLRGGYQYKTKKYKHNTASVFSAPSSSARRSTNSRRGFKKQGGSRRRRRVKAVII
jgi:predicted  nucleic acid-binding Zn-ribbon protein